MSMTLDLSAADRILVVSPHPDDESLAAGGLLLRAVERGAAVHIAYMTVGDNNPWAQRATERRIIVRAADRRRFGLLRQQEVSRALQRLGVPADAVSFHSFPDQGLTRLLLARDPAPGAALADEIARWQPTLVVGPSLLDRHPDHSAVAVLVELALAALPPVYGPARHLRFLVHRPGPCPRRKEDLAVNLGADQQQAKRQAIACHRSQAFWRGQWLLAFAGPQERFMTEEPCLDLAAHPIQQTEGPAGAVVLEVRSGNHWRAFGPRTLCLVAHLPGGTHASLVLRLPTRRDHTPVLDPTTGREVAQAACAATGDRWRVVLPGTLLGASPRVFAKVEHRFGFFDEAGWRPISVAHRRA